MNLVRLALRRPLSIVMMVIAISFAAITAMILMPQDILPTLGIPTIYVVQPYGGMSPSQMESYITYFYEYHFLYISGISHIESRNIESVALIKLQFYPRTDMSAAMSETVNYVNRARAFMPTGTVPPFVMRFDAGSAPLGNLVFSSSTKSLGELQNLALNHVRPLFATLKGVSAPPPFGANAKTIVVNIDPQKMKRYNLGAAEVAEAIASSNLITPSGNIPWGHLWPIVFMNSVVTNIKDLLDVPVRIGTVPTVYIKDIGDVNVSTDIPTGYALVNGRKTVYIPVTKRAEASTLAVVNLVKENISRFQSVLPQDVKIKYEFDQSTFVRQSIRSLTFEIFLGAGLVGLMVLAFLRSLRSVLIVVLNIPLALMVSIFMQWVMGQTINVMTLGGLALAVGILVDETTVTLENIHSHMEHGKSAARAALDATNEILKPKLLTLICILSVFAPSFFMTGVAKALFVPLSLSVGFAMIGSFVLSQTLVPVLCAWMLKHPSYDSPLKMNGKKDDLKFFSFHKLKGRYARIIEHSMKHKKGVTFIYVLFSLTASLLLMISVGKEIFPVVNQGQLKIRLRAATGTHIDETEKITLKVLNLIEDLVGKPNIASTLAFVGTQPSQYAVNNIYQFTAGPHEALLQVAIREGRGTNMDQLKENLRDSIQKNIPTIKTSFEPSGLIDVMMSQGSSTPIEISVKGPDLEINLEFAEKLMKEISNLKFLRDLQFGQVFDFPAIEVEINRAKAGAMGLTVLDISKALVPATSSTRFTSPNFWADPKTGINYQVQVQVPQKVIETLQELKKLPITVPIHQGAISLDRFAEMKVTKVVGEYDRFNMQKMITITANLFKKDLGHAVGEIKSQLSDFMKQIPRGVQVDFQGQMKSLHEVFSGLSIGLIFVSIVIFLFLSGSFESLSIALIILSIIPAAFMGALSALILTGSTLNIESFVGIIMSFGIAVANSILLVDLAEKDRLKNQGDAMNAALVAAQSRLRPILMTSCAMIIGMIPMSMGWSEGGEQTAPLGRAVIGGLSFSTLTTLFIVPLIFAVIQRKRSQLSASLDPDDPLGRAYER